MAIEIEKKYRLNSAQREQILAKLKEVGAVFSREDFEVNELYGGGILDEKRAVLRLRKIEGKTILTYKQRIDNNSAIKRQIEYETEIADAAAIEMIIESLGFEKGIIYEKRRQTWQFRNTEIVLDELPFGLFMEIEGSIAEITLTETLLEAENFETEHETYPRLTTKLGKQNKRLIEARFK
jgi:adenylate cyclase class 2